MLEIDAVVLAGGLGTRLRGAVPVGCPKILAPIGGRAFAEFLLERLYEQGIRRVVFSLGYGADCVVSFLKSRTWPSDFSYRYVVEPTPLGTGGALGFALQEVKSDPVLALNGDTFCDADLSRIISFHHHRHADITLAMARVADTGRYGAVEHAEDGKVTRFVEKATTAGPGLINCGVYVISKAVLKEVPSGKVFSWEKDVLAQRVGGKGLYALEAATRFIDIGTPDSLLTAASFLSERSMIQ